MKVFLIVFIFVLFIIPVFYFSYTEQIESFWFSRIRAQKLVQQEVKKPEIIKTISDTKDNYILDKKTFLEANLFDKKIRLYKDGVMQKEFNITFLGDVKYWGGSPAGINKIISGSKTVLSLAANVFMPYALRVYGKYYIHGEPYFENGEKRLSDFTGGCIQVKDSDAKEIFELVDINLPVIVIDKPREVKEFTSSEILTFPEITAESYLAADLASGYIFAEKNSKVKFPIASITKLMTAVVVSENNDLAHFINVKEYMLNAYGETEGLIVGKGFSIVDLFYPMLIQSSNDAAQVLSGFLGSIRTVELMNERAVSLEMENTNYVDSTGYDPENKSTAQDLFKLGRYLFYNRSPILQITKGKSVRNFNTDMSFKPSDFINKNIFQKDPNFLGGKVGFIKESEDTGLFLFKLPINEKESRDVAIIVLKSKDNKTDTEKIYNWLKVNYSKLPTEIITESNNNKSTSTEAGNKIMD